MGGRQALAFEVTRMRMKIGRFMKGCRGLNHKPSVVSGFESLRFSTWSPRCRGFTWDRDRIQEFTEDSRIEIWARRVHDCHENTLGCGSAYSYRQTEPCTTAAFTMTEISKAGIIARSTTWAINSAGMQIGQQQ